MHDTKLKLSEKAITMLGGRVPWRPEIADRASMSLDEHRKKFFDMVQNPAYNKLSTEEIFLRILMDKYEAEFMSNLN